MKRTFKTLFVLSISLFIFSCRAPIENDKFSNEKVLSGEKVSVKINFLGSVWGDENMNNGSDEIQLMGSYSDSFVANKSQKIHAVKINDDLYAEIKEIDDVLENKNIDLQSKAVPADPVKEEAKVRILAYDAQDNTYVKHIDYRINTDGNLEGEKLILDSGRKYTIYVISFNNSYLPKSTELSLPYEFDKDGYDEERPDFLYQKIENYTPNEALNIKLRHRISQVRIVNAPISSYYCPDPEDYDTCIQLPAYIDIQDSRVIGLHFPKGRIDIEKGIVFPIGKSEPINPYYIFDYLGGGDRYFPVIVPEDGNAYIEVKVTFPDDYASVLKLPIPKIPGGVRRSYSVTVKNIGNKRNITCKDLSIKPVDENIAEIEGECSISNLKKGDRVELFVEEGMIPVDDWNEIFRDTDYKPGDKFKFQAHVLTNCYYVGYNRDRKLVTKIKVFNSIGLIVGIYNPDWRDDSVGFYMYRDVLCKDFFDKLGRGYCMVPGTKNYGEQGDCEYLPKCNDEDDGSSPCWKKPSICEDEYAINYGGQLPCKMLYIATGYYPDRGFLVCDKEEGVECNSVSANTFKLPVEILSDVDPQKYKLEVSIVKNYPKGYLKDEIFHIKGLTNRYIRDEMIPYSSVWDIEFSQNYVPYHEEERIRGGGDKVIFEVKVREISTNLVVAKTTSSFSVIR